MHIGVPGLGGTLPAFSNTASVTITLNWDVGVVARLVALIAPDGTIRHTFFVSQVIQSPVDATHMRTHTASFDIYKFGPGL